MTERALLRLVPAPADEAPEVLFCSHCAAPPPTSQAARSRVCSLCGFGIVLSASATVAPRAGDAFVIIDGSLRLAGLSAGAERLLDVDEPDAVDRPVSDFLEPADAEPRSNDELLRSVIEVASGRTGPQSVVIRPTGEYGVRFTARLGRCGLPPGALLLLSDGAV